MRIDSKTRKMKIETRKDVLDAFSFAKSGIKEMKKLLKDSHKFDIDNIRNANKSIEPLLNDKTPLTGGDLVKVMIALGKRFENMYEDQYWTNTAFLIGMENALYTNIAVKAIMSKSSVFARKEGLKNTNVMLKQLEKSQDELTIFKDIVINAMKLKQEQLKQEQFKDSKKSKIPRIYD